MACTRVAAAAIVGGAQTSRFYVGSSSSRLGCSNGSRVSMAAQWLPGQPRPSYLDGSAPGSVVHSAAVAFFFFLGGFSSLGFIFTCAQCVIWQKTVQRFWVWSIGSWWGAWKSWTVQGIWAHPLPLGHARYRKSFVQYRLVPARIRVVLFGLQ